jgi:HK97 family phage major capsid protein
MAIEAIEKMKQEVETLKGQLESQKTEQEKQFEELQKEFDSKLESRKTSFNEKDVDSSVVAKAKKDGADLYLKSILTGKPMASFEGFKETSAIIEKAIVPTDISSWMAEEFSNQMLTKLEAELMIEPLFAKLTMPQNRNQFSIPGRATDALAYLIAPGADAIESTITAGKITFATSRIKTLVSVTDQADQEAVVAVIDLVKQELVSSLARASEKGIIAGDTALSDANDVRKAFDGLLKTAVAAGNTVDGTGAISAANVLAARKALGVYGLNLADLAIIAPVKVAYDMLGLDEVVTVDKYGTAATILTGEIGKLYGMPIVASAYVPENLDATGAVDTVTPGTKTAVLVVNKRFFGVADRGSIGIEEERKAVSSSTLYVGYRDVDFKKLSIVATPVVAIVNL